MEEGPYGFSDRFGLRPVELEEAVCLLPRCNAPVVGGCDVFQRIAARGRAYVWDPDLGCHLCGRKLAVFVEDALDAYRRAEDRTVVCLAEEGDTHVAD